jgi:hypothetical protein
VPAADRHQGRKAGSQAVGSRSSARHATDGGDVTTGVIVALMMLALYLGARWINSSAENAALRTRIAALKRELARRTR